MQYGKVETERRSRRGSFAQGGEESRGLNWHVDLIQGFSRAYRRSDPKSMA